MFIREVCGARDDEAQAYEQTTSGSPPEGGLVSAHDRGGGIADEVLAEGG